jgi:endo-1,4-beta-xylanase
MLATLQPRACAALLATVVATAAAAAQDPAAPCAATKLRASGAALDQRLRCEAVAARTNGQAARRCIAQQERRYQKVLARAEAGRGCLQVGAVAVFPQALAAFVDDARDRVRPASQPSPCAEAALRALGARGRAVLVALARDVRSRDPLRLAAARANADVRFGAAMADALAAGDCRSGTDAAALASAEDAFADTLHTTALPPLRSLAAARGRRIGAAVSSFLLANEPDYVATFTREFDAVTAEFEALWALLHPAPGVYQFNGLDAVAAFAESHGMHLRGHHLVWDEFVAGYLRALTPEALRAELEDHIRTVVGHYCGRMTTWVVVNEAVDSSPGLSPGLWLDTLGPGYIADAFRIAHEADPDAELIYNDAFADGINPKSDFIYAMVQDLLADGVPIHGVGFQMHLLDGELPPTLRENLQRFTDLGLRVQLTEMDVPMFAGNTLAARLKAQRGVYHDAVAACLAVSGCEAVTFWGFTDEHSWIDGFFGPDMYPLPFDTGYKPKPAYFGIRDALLGR